MRNLAQALYVELLKARRSSVTLFTALSAALLPLVGGFFMIVLKDPELAQRVGLISAKAHIMAGAADWPNYLELLAQGLAVGGIVLFGFVGSWVFGREYADRTAKDLLALPYAPARPSLSPSSSSSSSGLPSWCSWCCSSALASAHWSGWRRPRRRCCYTAPSASSSPRS
jgi:hypothetical protein